MLLMNNFTVIDSDILATLLNSIDTTIIKEFQNIVIPNYYNLVITGSVGVGKSTISQLMLESFKKIGINPVIYPEYINLEYEKVKFGDLMLKARSDNIISTETLQHFVLDMWELQLKNKEFNKHNSINILERLPEDAMTCFVNEAYSNKIINKIAYDNLWSKYNIIIGKYRVPQSYICNLQIVYNNNLIETVNEILKTVLNDFKNNIENRIIGLKIKPHQYLERIAKRGRIAEINTNTSIFEHYNEYYDNYYKEFVNYNKK